MTVVPVLEVGGTHVTAALVDTAVWRAGSVFRRGLDSGAAAEDIVAVLAGAGRQAHPHRAARWVVALPGPFDHATGVAWFSEVGKFDALYGFDLGAALRRTLPCDEVRFVNDAAAFTTGQWLSGAARGANRTVGVTLGTGVGSAWLVAGVAVRDGPGVPPGGRLDLVAVDGVPLEHLVSRRAVLAGYARLVGDRAAGVDVVDVAERARTGDRAAARALREAMSVLGAVLAPRTAAFEAEVVVVGGSIALSWDLVGPPLVAALTGRTARVLPARADVDCTLVGAVRAVG